MRLNLLSELTFAPPCLLLMKDPADTPAPQNLQLAGSHENILSIVSTYVKLKISAVYKRNNSPYEGPQLNCCNIISQGPWQTNVSAEWGQGVWLQSRIYMRSGPLATKQAICDTHLCWEPRENRMSVTIHLLSVTIHLRREEPKGDRMSIINSGKGRTLVPPAPF